MPGGEAPQTAVRRAGHGGRGRRIDAGGFEPTWVGELELSRPVSDLIAPVGPGGRPYRRARLLVRVHGQPIGFLELGLRDGVAAATTTLPAIEGALGDAIADHLRADGIEPEQLAQTGIAAVDQAPCEAPGSHGAADALATVIVCTRDRPASLRRTLGSLLEGDYAKLRDPRRRQRPGEARDTQRGRRPGGERALRGGAAAGSVASAKPRCP